MTDASECPDDEVLATFVGGAANEVERAMIETHVDGCNACGELLANLAHAYVSPSSAGRGDGSHARSAGRYELLSEIGRGGMGVVYEARDPMLGRRVALKVIHADAAVSQDLLREAQAMARVAHPNVVNVFDAIVEDDRVFLAIELVRGPSLRTLLVERCGLALEERVRLLREAARGLAAAHAANVVHRDFKPENVLVGSPDSPRARVTDFGLARPASTATLDPPPSSADARWQSAAETRGLHGTPAYLAPEQIDGIGVDARSDQFALGVTLFEAVYGVHPFGLGAPAGPTTLVALRSAMNRGTVAVPKDKAKVAAWLDATIRRALTVDPAHRFPTMAALADALEGPSEATRRRLGWLQVAYALMALVHFAFLALLIVAAFIPGEEPAASRSTWEVAEDVARMAWFLGGLVIVPLGMIGIARRTRWAFALTLAYAIASLPTCFGTTFSIVAAIVLAHEGVRVALGRMPRASAAGRSRSQ